MIDEHIETPAAPDDSGSVEDKTDEQIWKEIQDEEAKASTDDAATGAASDDEPDDTASADDAAVTAELAATEADAAPGADAQAAEDSKPDKAQASPPDQSISSDDPDATIMATASPEQQALFEKVSRQRDAANGRARQLQSQASAPAPTPAPPPPPATTDRAKKLADVKEEYPDVTGDVVDELTDLRATVAGLQQDREGDQARVQLQEQNLFMKEHPDGFAVVTKDQEAFNLWADDQPAVIRAAVKINLRAVVDHAAAIQVMDSYKAHLGKGDAPAPAADAAAQVAAAAKAQRLTDKRTRQLAGAQSSQSATSQSVTDRTKGAGAMTEEEEWEDISRTEERKARRAQQPA